MKLGSINEIPRPILVVMAYPGDIEVHCGATVAQLVVQGKQVTYLRCVGRRN